MPGAGGSALIRGVSRARSGCSADISGPPASIFAYPGSYTCKYKATLNKVCSQPASSSQVLWVQVASAKRPRLAHQTGMVAGLLRTTVYVRGPVLLRFK